MLSLQGARMVANGGNEKQRHWTQVTSEDTEKPTDKMLGVLLETSDSFFCEVASGNEQAVNSARRIVSSLAETLRPAQLAHLLETMLKNSVQHYNKTKSGD